MPWVRQLILADELSVGLAAVVVDEIFAAVRSMAAEGRSLLLVEQYDRAKVRQQRRYPLPPW